MQSASTSAEHRNRLNLESWVPKHVRSPYAVPNAHRNPPPAQLHPKIKCALSFLAKPAKKLTPWFRSLMLVGFGQSICKPVSPRCDLCDVSARNLCPSARVVSPKKERTPSKKRRLSSPDEENAERAGGRPKVEVKIDEGEVEEGVKEEEGDVEIKEEEKEGEEGDEAFKVEEGVLPFELLW